MRFSSSILLALILGTCCARAVATEPATKSTRGRPLSRNELRSCMDRSTELDKREDALKASQDEHNAYLKVLSEEALALSAELRGIDSSDDAAVDTYNKRNDERNRKVEINNERAKALNASAADFRAAVADFMADCVSRPFLKSDEEALLKEGVKGRKPINRSSETPAQGRPGRLTT